MTLSLLWIIVLFFLLIRYEDGEAKLLFHEKQCLEHSKSMLITKRLDAISERKTRYWIEVFENIVQPDDTFALECIIPVKIDSFLIGPEYLYFFKTMHYVYTVNEFGKNIEKLATVSLLLNAEVSGNFRTFVKELNFERSPSDTSKILSLASDVVIDHNLVKTCGQITIVFSLTGRTTAHSTGYYDCMEDTVTESDLSWKNNIQVILPPTQPMLDINYKNKFTGTSVEAGEILLISCRLVFEGMPPAIVTLKVGDEVLETSIIVHSPISNNDTSNFHTSKTYVGSWAVKPEDNNKLVICSIVQELASFDSKIKLNVIFKPEIQFVPLTEYLVAHASIKCLSKGNPEPKCHWRRISGLPGIRNLSLFIFADENTGYDSYRMRCICENSLGKVSKEINFTVIGPFQTPLHDTRMVLTAYYFFLVFGLSFLVWRMTRPKVFSARPEVGLRSERSTTAPTLLEENFENKQETQNP